MNSLANDIHSSARLKQMSLHSLIDIYLEIHVQSDGLCYPMDLVLSRAIARKNVRCRSSASQGKAI